MNNTNIARVGALCLIVAAPVFLAANVITGLAWNHPSYSWSTHNISDLGNVTCGIWDSSRPRPVCSPWHALFNTSAAVTAALLIAGIILTWRRLGSGPVVRVTQSLVLVAATGYALAAAYPADVNEDNHFLGALLIMGFGNIGMLVACFAPRSTTLGRARALTLPMAVIAVVGSTLFFSQQGLGIGVGGMERLAVFPLTIWAACVGASIITARTRPQLANPILRGL